MTQDTKNIYLCHPNMFDADADWILTQPAFSIAEIKAEIEGELKSTFVKYIENATTSSLQAHNAKPVEQLLSNEFGSRDAKSVNNYIKTDMPTSFGKALVAIQKKLNVTNTTDVVTGLVDVPLTASDEATIAHYQENGTKQKYIPLTFPLKASVAEELYESLDQSTFGEEGHGDVSDLSRRSSRECPLSASDPACIVQVPFKVLSFDFPEERKKIRESFCGNAPFDLKYQPYKFVLYSRGDFFLPHVDSMNDPRQIASLAVQVPILDDGFYSDDDDTKTHSNGCSNDSGNIIFYLGRQQGGMCFNNSERWSSYGRPKTQEEELKLTLDLTSHATQNKRATSTYKVKYAAWLGDVVHEVSRVTTKFRAVLLFRLFRVEKPLSQAEEEERTAQNSQSVLAPLHANFLTHQPFSSYTFQAMLLRDLSPVDARSIELGSLLRQIMSEIVFAMERTTSAKKGSKEERYCPKYLGVILRHVYPPAGLLPCGLKGGDAALYAIASKEYEVTLHSGYELRTDYPSTPYRANYLDSEGMHFTKLVALTTDKLEDLVNLGSEDAEDLVARKCPFFTAGAWIQQGFGVVVKGGHAYGNADCGSDWWYRSAVMIIHPTPSKRRRCIPLILVGLRGPPAFRRLLDTPDVFLHIASFM